MNKHNDTNSMEVGIMMNTSVYVTLDAYTKAELQEAYRTLYGEEWVDESDRFRLWRKSCLEDERYMFRSRYNDAMEKHYQGTKLEAFGNLVFEVYEELQRGVRYSESMLNLDYIDKAQVREYLCWCAAAGVAASRLQEGLRLRKKSDYDVKPNRLWRNPNSYVQADRDNKYGDKSLICYKYFYNVEKRSGTRALDIIPILNEFVRDNRLHILDIYRNLFLR